MGDILDNKQGMKVISRSTLAKCSSKLAGSYTPLGWRHYTDEEKARHSAKYKGIAAQIDALGHYPDPDAVDQIIGNDTWTCCRCDHCGSKVEYVVQINFSACRITNLCANCIRKAMAIVEDQPSKSLSFWTKHMRSTSSCGSSGLTGEEREAADSPATWQDECADVEAAFARSNVRPTWPDDEPANIGPMAAAMADEVARLRLTDAEREAVESAMDIAEAVGNPYLRNALRGLLARHGGGA